MKIRSKCFKEFGGMFLKTPEIVNKISEEINIRLAKELMADSKEEFKQFLDEVGETMKERGLTEDILQDILKEDE